MRREPGRPVVEEQLAILSEVIARGDLMPGSKAHALRTRGRVLALNGRHEEAMRDLDEAMRLDPANYFNHGYAATVLASAGRDEEAEQRLRQ